SPARGSGTSRVTILRGPPAFSTCTYLALITQLLHGTAFWMSANPHCCRGSFPITSHINHWVADTGRTYGVRKTQPAIGSDSRGYSNASTQGHHLFAVQATARKPAVSLQPAHWSARRLIAHT